MFDRTYNEYYNLLVTHGLTQPETIRERYLKSINESTLGFKYNTILKMLKEDGFDFSIQKEFTLFSDGVLLKFDSSKNQEEVIKELEKFNKEISYTYQSDIDSYLLSLI